MVSPPVKKHRRRNVQGVGEACDDAEGKVAGAAFNAAELRLIHARLKGEGLLRQLALAPELPDIPAKGLGDVHRLSFLGCFYAAHRESFTI